MTDRVSRRRFLAYSGAAAGTLLWRGPAAVADLRARRRVVPLVRRGRFRHGVAAGEPSADGITLWTRVAGLEGNGRLRLEVAHDEGFGRVVHRETVLARAGRDHTIKVRIGKGALRPAEEYFYRFETLNESSPVGRFRTTPPPDSRQPVRIAFFSCQAYEAGYYGAHAALSREDVDLVVCVGDYIYERAFGFDGPAGREDTQGPNRDGDVQTLDEYRGKYRLYRRDPNLQRMHAAHAFAATWDDHEVSDDYTGDEHPDDRPLRIPFEVRRRNAYRAFFEYLPVARHNKDPFRIYRRFRLGRLVELFALDERQYADPPPCGGRVLVPCLDTDAPRQHLGRAQRRWFERRVTSSAAVWKLVANPKPLMSIHSAGFPIDPRNWDGYARERRELLAGFRTAGIRNLAFISGSIHTFFAAEVGTEGRGPDPMATEFVAGSITTTGLPEALSFQTGGLVSAEQARLITEQIPLTNPHIKFQDQRAHGYAVVEARPDELRVRFRAVDRFDPHASKATTLATMRVPRDRAAVEM
jgi:alkaline phosphatase D